MKKIIVCISDDIVRMDQVDDVSVKATFDKDLIIWPLPFLLVLITLSTTVLPVIIVRNVPIFLDLGIILVYLVHN